MEEPRVLKFLRDCDDRFVSGKRWRRRLASPGRRFGRILRICAGWVMLSQPSPTGATVWWLSLTVYIPGKCRQIWPPALWGGSFLLSGDGFHEQPGQETIEDRHAGGGCSGGGRNPAGREGAFGPTVVLTGRSGYMDEYNPSPSLARRGHGQVDDHGGGGCTPGCFGSNRAGVGY